MGSLETIKPTNMKGMVLACPMAGVAVIIRRRLWEWTRHSSALKDPMMRPVDLGRRLIQKHPRLENPKITYIYILCIYIYIVYIYIYYVYLDAMYKYVYIYIYRYYVYICIYIYCIYIQKTDSWIWDNLGNHELVHSDSYYGAHYLATGILILRSENNDHDNLVNNLPTLIINQNQGIQKTHWSGRKGQLDKLSTVNPASRLIQLRTGVNVCTVHTGVCCIYNYIYCV